MQSDTSNPQNVYRHLSQEVDSLLEKLDGLIDQDELADAKETAEQYLTTIQTEINKNMAALERNAEWDTFTIAFYGETNAGKSTIIEALRIALGETTKLESQQTFNELQAKHNLSADAIEALRKSSSQNEGILIELKEKRDNTLRQHGEREMALRMKIERLQDLLAEKKRTASLWQKILSLLQKQPEEKEKNGVEQQLKAAGSDSRATIAIMDREQQDAQNHWNQANQELERVEHAMLQLEPLSDGGIIGNGKSDFTLDAQLYAFESGAAKFDLIDVPGIEGKEAKVIASIEDAVKKAHAVFYVTSKAAPPQTGEGDSKGTLEKIKSHLGDQTEVWTLFNKRVTNPMQLEKNELISADERDSLKVLDKKMQEQLGENYRQTLTLSAQPAFLAVADCLIPGSSHATNKAKFLGRLSSTEILEKSNFSSLLTLLTQSIATDYKAKIKRANFRKANHVLTNAADSLTHLKDRTFEPLKKTLQKSSLESCAQISNSLAALKKRIKNRGDRAVDHFEAATRDSIYCSIDRDISNDSFKSALASCISEQQTKMKQDLPDAMEAEMAKFQQDIKHVLERFQEHASDLLNAYGQIHTNNSTVSFDLKIDIDNGLKMSALLGALAAGVAMIWNPAGWVVLTVSAATLLVTLGKALYGMFSSDYKKAEQRKAADRNLETITSKLRESMKESIDSAFAELKAHVDRLKKAVEEPVRQVAAVHSILVQSTAALTSLSNATEKAGAK